MTVLIVCCPRKKRLRCMLHPLQIFSSFFTPIMVYKRSILSPDRDVKVSHRVICWTIFFPLTWIFCLRTIYLLLLQEGLMWRLVLLKYSHKALGSLQTASLKLSIFQYWVFLAIGIFDPVIKLLLAVLERTLCANVNCRDGEVKERWFEKSTQIYLHERLQDLITLHITV